VAIDIVTNTSASGAGSLAQTLANATAGDTIEFAAGLSGDTIDLASTLTITKNITIDGNANGANISLSGGNGFTDVKVNAGITASLTGLDIIQGGTTGAAGHGETFTGSYNYLNPGTNAAGGIYNAGTLTITDSVFSSDAATGGAGVSNHYTSDGGGAGGSAAGGIYTASGSVLNIDTADVTFTSDSAHGGAGGQGAGYGGYAGGAGGAGGSQTSGSGAVSPTAGSVGSGQYGGAGGAKAHHGHYGQTYNMFGTPYHGAGGGGGGGYAFANYGGKGTIHTACFRQGTNVRTPEGEVAVEDLRIGDPIATVLGGATARVRWVGHRRSDCTRHPNPAELWPVRITAGAFAPGLPARDLWLSPGHAVHVPDDGGALIPVRFLVNGASIAQQTVAQVSYFHVELDAHDVLFAEGLAAETYLDTGNRSAFANCDGAVQAFPDFSAGAAAARPCAPLLTGGPVVLAVRQRLLDRAATLGWTRSSFPALRITATGQTLVQRHDADWLRVALPAGTGDVRLQSRRAVPPDLLGDRMDSRSLGVLVCAVMLDGTPVALDDVALGAGWHAPEPGVRWTDGDAQLHCAGAATLALRVAAAPEYWLVPPAAAEAGAHAA
jgi:hypothetical protein